MKLIFMKGFSSMSVGIIVALIIGLIIIFSVLGIGQTARGVQTPVAGFFELFGKIGDYLSQRVFLASEQTKDIFCEKQLNEALELCKIESEELKNYCSAEDRESLCQDPTGTMEEFCKQNGDIKDKACTNQRGFFEFCSQLKTTKDLEKLAESSGALALKTIGQIALCR